MLRIACDDGSTNVKLAWYDNGALKTHISPNSFKDGWSTDIFSSNAVYNYEITGHKYTYDIGSRAVIDTTHISYQYGIMSRLAIHHALLTSGLFPQEVELTVTLPVTEFFTKDSQINEDNIRRKKQNVLGELTLNKGETFTISNVFVMPESIPAARESLIKDQISSFERSLILDLGGTTLDCAVIQGELESISEIKGNSEIGTSRLTKAVMNALSFASSPSSYVIADEVIKNIGNQQLLQKIINDQDKIQYVIDEIKKESKYLADSVITEIATVSNINRIYLTGGGAEIVYPYIKEEFSQYKPMKVDDAQLALVKAIAQSGAK
ncbi:TPA: plasmid segregation protein ParM domain-containing protein [Providencia alcalifaciens]|uniref:plasmid segregation protein ParM domain-containing protein n=1 Tax=Providencia alcalifaciens TaxID=126385 RepID=UPI00044F6083|nr:plasmid segregation protein ParM domain-containing protein [Providencia alcalifaciens]ETT06933.1 StbA protein [Providencia alcalifaciens F90-2004]